MPSFPFAANATPSAAQGGFPHLPALDGLRGIALLGVLFFHSKKALPGGYLGVDLFFVLSGYLITALLLHEHGQTGKIDLKAFWIRRARRLFPALLSLIPAIALYCQFFADGDELARIRGDALATLGYAANWWSLFSHKSYWEMFASPSPLEHTWSLAIEEQFYIAWPLIVVLALRGQKQQQQQQQRRILRLTLVLLALSVITAAVLITLHPARTSRVYFGTDTRAAAILAGAALASILPPTAQFRDSAAIKRLDVLGAVAILILAAAWWKLEGDSPFLYRGGFWITELAAVVLIVCAVAGPSRSVIGRVLAFRPLTLVGLISYGLYLWHWPVNVFLTSSRFEVLGTFTSVQIRALQFVVAFAIAIVSYRFFEKPIRTRGLPFKNLRFARPLIVVPAAVALSIFVIVRATHPRPSLMHPPGTVDTAMPPPPPPPFEANAVDAGDEGETLQFKIAIFGDSTANSIGWTMRGVQRPNVSIALLGRDGCNLLYDTCYGEKWSAQLQELEPSAIVLYLGGAFEHEAEASDGRWVSACHPEWNARFEKNLTMRFKGLLADAKKISDAGGASSARVFWLTTPIPINDELDKPEVRRQIVCINKTIRSVTTKLGEITVIELGDRICPEGKCTMREEGISTPIRPDGIHFHMDGARPLSTWVLDQLMAQSPDSTPP